MIKIIIFSFIFILTSCLQQGKTPVGESDIPQDITISLLTVNPSIKILGLGQSSQFEAVGGYPPYTFSLMSGYGSVTSDGFFTAPGAPTTSTIKVVDSQNSSAFAVITVSSSLVLSPANATVGTSSTFQFSSGGGVAPYTYALVSGVGSIDASTGVYTAPASSGVAVVKVTDSNANVATANINVTASLTLSPSSLIMEDNNFVSFSAVGGVAPYVYSVYTGGGVINSTTGAYTSPANDATVIIRVQDANGLIDEANITVVKGPQISTFLDKVAVSGTLQFSLTEGTAPFTYSVITGTGVIDAAGLFTAPATPELTTIRVTDANGFVQDKIIEVFIPTKVGLGDFHMCMVRQNPDGVTSTSKCVGRTQFGETAPNKVTLGDQASDMGDNLPAVNLGTGVNVLRVFSSHNNRICALLSDYKMKCFGENSGGGAGTSSGTVHGYNINTMGTYLPFVGLGTGITVDNTVDIKKSVAVGGAHTCAIITGGALKCWGTNTNGQLGLGNAAYYCNSPATCNNNLPTVPLGGETVLQVVAGEAHTCALLSPSMRVKCWGYNLTGQLGLGDATVRGTTAGTTPDLLNYVDLGTYLGNPVKVKSIAAGWSGNCVILENDTVKCWGTNTLGFNGKFGLGHLGDAGGEMGDTLTTVSISSTKTPLEIYSKVYSACVVFTDYTMKCWGQNDFGQLGLGDINSRGDAVNEMGDFLPFVDVGEGVSEVSPGYQHTCAKTLSGKVKCWGYNLDGRLGVLDQINKGDNASEMGANLPFISLSSTETVSSVAVSSTSACARLSNGTLKCWGFDGNLAGVFGLEVAAIGAKPNEKMPLLPSLSFGAGNYAKDILTSYYATCFVMMNNSMRCFGYNSFGDFGLGNTTNKGLSAATLEGNAVQLNFGSGLTFTQFAVGAHVICGLVNDGRLKCSGYGLDGRNGLGTGAHMGDGVTEFGDALPFVDVGADVVKSVHTKSASVCAVFTNNKVKCWGYNLNGTLGYDDNVNRGHTPGTTPANLPYVDLGLGRTVKQLAMGIQHVCAILDNDKVKCWGYNNYGQLGYEDVANRGDAPGEMAALGYVDLGTGLVPKKIVLGHYHSCVQFTNNKIKCWGKETANGSGDWLNKGNIPGSMGDSLQYVNFGSTYQALDLFAGGLGTCVVLEDNSVKCWGDNSFGQLGLGHKFNFIGADPLSMGNNLPAF